MKKITPKAFRQRGFALVVTLSLMILLTVIAVGLLSLSSISLRSASQSSSVNLARTNARLAMILALGELQVAMGPDTSVSAPASSVISSPPRPNLTGAWQRPTSASSTSSASAWHWTPDATGAPTYTDKAALFSRWLISTANPVDSGNFGLPSTALNIGTDVVNLVGNTKKPLTNNNVSTLVTASKVKVGSTSQLGKFAWSVFDESTKAAIQLGNPATKQTVGEEIASRSAPYRVRADILDAKLKTSLEFPKNLISLDTAVVPGGTSTQDEFKKRFHDFTTSSVGLLTDTANGGLKIDLTSLFEDDGTVFPTGAFPAANPISPYAYPTSNPATAGALSWKYLKDHYRKYRTITQNGGELTYRPNTISDLKINTQGTTAAPDSERLIPVIAKFQMMFSLVTHYSYLKTRRDQLNQSAVPKGYINFGIPNLAYDPVITLYNPYDVTLDLTKLRIRIWDPPVGFRFKKVDTAKGTSVYLRPNDLDKGEVKFRSMGTFRAGYETNDNARKCITMILTNGTPAASSNRLKLLPGEVKVYSPRVESNWTWTMEAGDGSTDSYPTRSFFDYGNKNYSNIDGRTASGVGQYGIEVVPGWDTRAGLQTDHLSNASRDPSTLYDFEAAKLVPTGGFVNMRITDDIVVEAKPLVTNGTSTKSFQVDILAGATQGAVDESSMNNDSTNSGVATDRLRSYSFNFASATDPSAELNTTGGSAIISRQFNVKDILQGPGGETGKKKPFALLELSSRTTKDDTTDSKPWLYNNPVVEGAVQASSVVGLAAQSYDLRFREVTSFTGFPRGIDIDGNPNTNRGYFGASGAAQDGSSFVNMMHVPAAPAASLGDLVHANLVGGSQLPRVMHAFGNSRAHPLIRTSTIAESLGGTMLDHSYLLNDALWDRYYFSSVAKYTQGNGVIDKGRARSTVLTGMFDGTAPALNSRLMAVNMPSDPATLAKDIDNLATVPRSRQLAKYLGVTGAFNLSSTSLDAWRAVLSSLRDRTVNGGAVADVGGNSTVSSQSYSNDSLAPFARSSRPLAGSGAANSIRWAGFRALTDAQITNLAQAIVAEIVKTGVKDKAPAFSLGEFVNRRIGTPDSLHALAGLLQTAIDKSNINDDSRTQDSKFPLLSAASVPSVRQTGVVTKEVMDGYSSEGAPSMITQGDLMSALAPIATVRGDTFKIRCYGEATATNGTTVVARAWCEAVVQRMPDFVDSRDAPETEIASLTSDVNKKFGRRFNIVSFRWLSEDEI